jgi:hypothetical protein
MASDCIACGMPMTRPEDHAMGDVRKDYCIHCARPDGTMQSYEEKLESMSGYLMSSQGLNAETARAVSRNRLSKLPAWLHRPADQ